MLDIRNLAKSFGGPAGRSVLDAVSLVVRPGEYVAIDGESNWMEGAMLVGVYAMLAIAFYFLPA